MVNNQFKVIEAFPDYSINERGDIYSSLSHKLMKHQIMSRGKYKVISLVNQRTGYKATQLIHRLVAEAFVPNPNDHELVTFKDKDVNNIHASNLRWCSYSEILSQQHNNGLRDPKNRNWEGRKPKPVIQYSKYGHELNRFPTLKAASEATGVSTGSITRCASGEVKNPRYYQWKYDEQ